MNVIAVAGETPQLDAMELAIRRAAPDAGITTFSDAKQMLAWPHAGHADVAFVDAELPGIGGVEAALQLQKRNPRMNIVFVASRSACMEDALCMHASGYIAVPISAEKVRNELDWLRFPPAPAQTDAASDTERKLELRCFGNFEAFADGKPLPCESGRALELLAYLADRRGRRCSVAAIEASIWEHDHVTPSHQAHLRKVAGRLARCLKAADFEDVFQRAHGFMWLDTAQISCDYWDYLDGKPGAERLFHGEYMAQYSWAERTLGRLISTYRF